MSEADYTLKVPRKLANRYEEIKEIDDYSVASDAMVHALRVWLERWEERKIEIERLRAHSEDSGDDDAQREELFPKAWCDGEHQWYRVFGGIDQGPIWKCLRCGEQRAEPP